MIDPMIEQKRIREDLKAKRNLLFEEFSKNPLHTSLAIEIRSIDDHIAEITERLVQHRKKEAEAT